VLFFASVGVKSASAFDKTFTHPYLTDALAKEWNRRHHNLSDRDMAALTRGSREEDEPNARSLNHFYNPLTREGLSVSGLIAGYGAPEWAQSRTEQSEPLFGGQFTWPEALNAYQTGDREAAFLALGHVLHVVEDMAVPAHTRNDEHLEGDGFEDWVKSVNGGETPLALDWSKVEPSVCPTLAACFNELALFSNANFFSDDTIGDQEFAAPWSGMTLGADNYVYANGRIVAWLDGVNHRLILNDRVWREHWRSLTPRLAAAGLQILNLFFNATADSQPAISPKTRGQISAGGVKISAGEAAPHFNWPTSEPKRQSVKDLPADWWQLPANRFFPVIDVSQSFITPWLGSGQPLTYAVAPASGHAVVGAPAEPGPEIKTVESPEETNGVAGEEKAETVVDRPVGDELADAEAPIAVFNQTSSVVAADSLTLTWSGWDNVSPENALLFFLSYQVNDAAPWVDLLNESATTSLTIANDWPEESRLTFKLRARDAAGNLSESRAASYLLFRANGHNALLTEKLEHLFHFSECRGLTAADSLGERVLDQRADWVAGRWGCGVRQSYEETEADGLNFSQPLAASGLTLSFFYHDVSDFPRTHSRNRFVLYSQDLNVVNDWVLAALPTLSGTEVYVNGQRYRLPALPEDHDWHQVAVVVNADYLAYYVDGALTEQILGDFAPASPVRGLSIVGENAPGEFDEVAIWSRSLLSPEIAGLATVNEPLKPYEQN